MTAKGSFLCHRGHDLSLPLSRFLCDFTGSSSLMPLWSWPGSEWYDDESGDKKKKKRRSPLPLLIKFCVFLYLQSLSCPCTLCASVCVSACVYVRDTPQGAWERSSCGQKENTHVSFGFHPWLVQQGIWQSAEKPRVNVCISDHMSCAVVCPALLYASYLLLCHYLQALCLTALRSLRIYNFKRQL